ncbi:uncharacterized protein DFL_006932 [Arthrobotrys flagrans]|uniref:Globin-sensor domain-containing protein n=1 Tax=Arthrobotrys flagrans TaxID=97331 RepID=A0A436ZU71_ARTFL|nr:hypothetical protein DFL_006932 [Arthrobotrys flagrans]
MKMAEQDQEHHAEAPPSMEHIDRTELYTSLPVRIQFLHSFLEFGPEDVAALIAGQKYVKALIPAIVNIVYKKLLKYDITARVFTTRNSRDEGPVSTWATEDSAQIMHRKMFLRWYLTKLNSDCTRMEYWEYLDKVGLMHVGKGRKNPLHVEYVFLGVCLGFIQDAMFEAILSHPRLELYRKIALIKALGKVIWIQNDLMERWHNADALEFLEEEPLDEEDALKEGYLHGKQMLGDDDVSTILGRPIEEATHLMDGMNMGRCPFSGMARPDPAHLERQRAVPSRPAVVNTSGNGLTASDEKKI